MSRTRVALSVLALAAVVGCGSDPVEPPPGGATLVIVSGDNQTGEVSSPLASPLTVRVEDDAGDPVSGQTVSWALASAAGPGSDLSATSTTSATDGTTSIDFTLGETEGTYEVRAAISGSTVTFTATATSGPLNLAVGEDVVLSGATLGDVKLPEATAATEYQVVVTPLPETLGFTNMELQITAAGGSPQVARPAGAIARPAGSFALQADVQTLIGGARLPDWRSTQFRWDMHLRELERPLRPAFRAATETGGFALMAAAPQVGDVLDFGFSCVAGSAMFPNAPDSVTAEVVSVSTNAVIFEDTLSRGAFTPAEYDAIAANFDANIVGTDNLYFGAPSDVPGDIAPGQVAILYTQGVNRMDTLYTDGFVAGFFCPDDLIAGQGNNAKMFYLLVPDPNGDYTDGDDVGILTKQNVLRITDNTVAHEYQHLINFEVGSGAVAEVATNEGLSHLAEEVVGHAVAQSQGLANFAPGNELGPSDILASQTTVDIFNTWYLSNWQNLSKYLSATRDTSALLNASDPFTDPETFRMRGTNWMFLRYLLDRFGDPATEWQLTQALITDGASNHREAITNVFGAPYEQLVAEWTAMLVVEDAGVGVRSELTLPSWQMRSLYDDSSIGPVLNFPNAGGWPLVPAEYSLGAPAVDPENLFAGTSAYVTLSSSGAAGATGLRLAMAGTGADVPASVMPRMVIIRTK